MKTLSILLLFCVAIVLTVHSSHQTDFVERPEENTESNGRRPMEKVPGPWTIWQRVLVQATNGTGFVSSDPVLEKLIQRAFDEYIKPKVEAGEAILGSVLDPVWLWPIGPVHLKKGRGRVFRGEILACNLHMHNLKSAHLTKVEVRRDEHLSIYAVKVVAKVPIVWMTGTYSLRKSLLFGFLPTGGSGDFNVDLKGVTVGLITTLKAPNSDPQHFGRDLQNQTSSRSQVILDTFELGMLWQDVGFKFSGLWKGFNHVADILLNQLNVGDILLRKERAKIIQELEDYTRGLFECVLFNPYQGLEECMKNWWISRGWAWPWTYPICN